jgi:hypothetical protein
MDYAIKVDIKKPIWNNRKVGIADFRVKSNRDIHMTISYKGEDGNLLYPYTYVMNSEKIRTYPTMDIRNNIKLYVVPISDFEVKE